VHRTFRAESGVRRASMLTGDGDQFDVVRPSGKFASDP
jgi:hypothetical protein